MKKIYLSHPIGYDKTKYDAIKRHSRRIQSDLEKQGWDVCNPWDNGVAPTAPISEHMRKDFAILLKCDAIFLAEGWEYSSGCRAEFAVAVACRMEIVYETTK